MNERWGEWDDLTPEEQEAIEASQDGTMVDRLRAATLLHNQAIAQLSHNDIALNEHNLEHCERIQDLERRVKFLEDMLLNGTTQGGSE